MDSPHDKSTPSEGNRRWFLSALGLGATAYLTAKGTGVAQAKVVAPPGHTDIPHTDTTATQHFDSPHIDNVIPHNDLAHLDSVGPPHVDTGHIDSTHQDLPHGDIPAGHTDIPHTDLKTVGGGTAQAVPATESPHLNRWLAVVIA